MEIAIRATIIFFFLWALTRGLGKRELSEMTAFELLLLVVVGDLVQQGVTQEDYSLTGALIAAGTLGVWVLIFAYVAFKFPRSHGVLEGVPVVVVRDGQPLADVLQIERLNLDELNEAARNQGIADLREIRIGVLEPDGRFSFIKSDGERPTSPDEHLSA